MCPTLMSPFLAICVNVFLDAVVLRSGKNYCISEVSIKQPLSHILQPLAFSQEIQRPKLKAVYCLTHVQWLIFMMLLCICHTGTIV